jgi:folylpolyglutamate synthase/dihydropteroate synthase
MKKKQLDILLDNTQSLNGLKKSEFIKNEENARAEKRLSEMLNKKQQKLFDKFNNQVNNKVKKSRDYSINNLKIIGITGSCGKTSVALLVHRYLISIGKKSVLYSSAYIDSPASGISRSGAFESIHLDETELLNIINECKAYEAEYLILEC